MENAMKILRTESNVPYDAFSIFAPRIRRPSGASSAARRRGSGNMGYKILSLLRFHTSSVLIQHLSSLQAEASLYMYRETRRTFKRALDKFRAILNGERPRPGQT